MQNLLIFRNFSVEIILLNVINIKSRGADLFLTIFFMDLCEELGKNRSSWNHTSRRILQQNVLWLVAYHRNLINDFEKIFKLWLPKTSMSSCLTGLKPAVNMIFSIVMWRAKIVAFISLKWICNLLLLPVEMHSSSPHPRKRICYRNKVKYTYVDGETIILNEVCTFIGLLLLPSLGRKVNFFKTSAGGYIAKEE